ncbi:hypothetical protein E4U30_002251 [Claviceps sp. LM220 group G6]|nr:hypothetical protein E4U30_002251 [Claviceps sp. LM220 group G6]
MAVIVAFLESRAPRLAEQHQPHTAAAPRSSRPAASVAQLSRISPSRRSLARGHQ